uniref:Uncharacterized protein n=1 Tax=Clytia hemisphaerica TaxID=252671 RepID=A0A7M5V786_9CNID
EEVNQIEMVIEEVDDKSSSDSDSDDADDQIMNEEDIKKLQTKLKMWMAKHPQVTRGQFGSLIERSAGTVSDLINKKQTPSTKQGITVWHVIKKFLEDKSQQDALISSAASSS